MPQAQRAIDVGVSPEKFFDVVQDFTKYPEFIPELKRVSVLRKAENTQDVEFEIELALPLGIKKAIRYSLAFTADRPKSVRWRLISGEVIKGNTGSWTLRPLGENRTEAVYSIDLSLGALLPRAVSNFLAEQSLPRLLSQYKARAESLR
jgi:coenzyme Q-binding protein COQ10